MVIIFWRCFNIKNELRINEEIREKEVRLIAPDGSMVGVVPIKEAQALANQNNMDLVMIAPQAVPPVCKVMDYGKYIFDLAKKEKEAKKNQKVISVKEIKFTPSTEEHDFNFKLKNAIKFLKNGDKVKVSVKFRGREMNYTSLGEQLIERFVEAVSEYGTQDKKPKLEGKNMSIMINPKEK